MSDVRAGSEIDGFRVEEEVHAGGMAVLYRVTGSDGTLPLLGAQEGLRLLAGQGTPSLAGVAQLGHCFQGALVTMGPSLLTPRLLSPYEEQQLLPLGYGITNVVDRATAAADELEAQEYILGGRRLVTKLRKYRPAVLAVLGVGAYRTAFQQPRGQVGKQDNPLEGSAVWVLPNPSGLNASYQMDRLVEVFSALRREVERLPVGAAGTPAPR